MLILPVTDPRHEFNSEQINQAENCYALALCVRMNRVRLNLGFVFLHGPKCGIAIAKVIFHRKAKNLTSGANSLRDGASVRLLAGRHINLVIGLREHVS
jgi:hypothetical protein